MTIAIALKLGDGLILGADSAVTIARPGAYPENVYFNAEKIINVVKGLPLGAVTYGLGGFRGRSVARLAKDLRLRLSAPGDAWWVDPERYTVEEVAGRLKEFFYDDLYRSEYPRGGEGTRFGFMAAGHGPGAAHGEVWAFDVTEDGVCHGPINGIPSPEGLLYRGESEPLNRLVRGWSWTTVERMSGPDLSADEVIAMLDSTAPLWHPYMPLQDGLDVVRYLVDVAAGYVRYFAQPPIVAPPTDLAAITLHEGFRWVARKQYFPSSLNPEPSR